MSNFSTEKKILAEKINNVARSVWRSRVTSPLLFAHF